MAHISTNIPDIYMDMIQKSIQPKYSPPTKTKIDSEGRLVEGTLVWMRYYKASEQMIKEYEDKYLPCTPINDTPKRNDIAVNTSSFLRLLIRDWIAKGCPQVGDVLKPYKESLISPQTQEWIENHIPVKSTFPKD